MHFMHGYGIKTSDILFVPFGYGLYIAWWGFQAALEQAGVMIVPGGAQSSKDRVRNIFEWGATVVCGTPTYLLHLGETAAEDGDASGGFKGAALWSRQENRGPTYPPPRRLLRTYGVQNAMMTSAPRRFRISALNVLFSKGTHVIESMFYAECLDPDTLKPVRTGEVGELVLSNLCTESMPLLRYPH